MTYVPAAIAVPTGKQPEPQVDLFRRVFATPCELVPLQADERLRILSAGWRVCGLDYSPIIISLDRCRPAKDDLTFPTRDELRTAWSLLESVSGRLPPELFEPAVAFLRMQYRRVMGVDLGPLSPRTATATWPTPYIPPEVTALVSLLQPAQPAIVDVEADENTAFRLQLTAADLRHRANEIGDSFRNLLREEAAPPLLRLGAAFSVDFNPGAPTWFLGDLHGDLLALECCIEIADRLSAPETPVIVLLGDLFDDGGFGTETVLRVLERCVQKPGSLLWIAGNHDDAFGYDPETQSYFSTVIPCDFADHINQSPDGSADRVAGWCASHLIPRLPRAVLFDDGLLASHGGFPLPDMWPHLRAAADLYRPEALRDFAWARAHDRTRHKMPSRVGRISDFGRDDLAGFSALLTRLLNGRPVHRLIRGHDHLVERYALHPTYQRVTLRTVNSMCRRLTREIFGPYVRSPVMARYVPDANPVMYRVRIPDEAVYDAYPFLIDYETRDS